MLPVLSYSQTYGPPIIDMHLHDYTEQTYYVAPAPDGVFSPKDYETYKIELFKALKENNIVKAVVSTIGGNNTLDDEGILIPGYYTNSLQKIPWSLKHRSLRGNSKFLGKSELCMMVTPCPTQNLNLI